MPAQRGRSARQMRPIAIEPGFPSAAAGSVMICCGQTRVLCTASISTDLPRWMQESEPPRGWVTAEYNMLPGSTPDRKRRGNDSRGTEIQRLIGRVLRAAVDLEQMPGVMITCDCDVILADGGTRTTSITGAFVALALAINQACRDGLINRNPILGPVAAISVGIVDDKPYLDLDYQLDSRAQVDMNVAMNHKGQFIEIQGTGEGGTFSREQLDSLLDLACGGIKKLIRAQRAAISAAGQI